MRDMKPVDFDLLSHEAFITENVRKTVWGQGFTHFLPLALTQQHFGKALPLLKTVLVELNLTTKSKEFRPETALHVISKLMNLMVVDLMKACDADSTFTQPVKMYETPKPIVKTKMIASEKALTGYSQLLHLLLSFCELYPQLVTFAENQLERFLHVKTSRGKQEYPNLGEFIILLFCQDKYAWDDLSVPVFRECSVRNVVWMLDPRHGNKPSLALLESDNTSEFRLKESFTAQQTSLRLLMFQVLFMRRLGVCDKPWKELLGDLNNSYGYPRASLTTQIVQDIKRMYAVKSFDAFLGCVGIPVPSKKYFCILLKEAIVLSKKRQYHRCPYNWNQLNVLRVEADKGFRPSADTKVGTVNEFKRGLSFFLSS
ncbi:UNVERIFIED_CONTAM: hypothetical protein HDU68_012064 [Siphonaria sp. JEL0065]|nr:hypothetical protein HDU68_012064 [Siphonaria sp. JEL0065]